MANENDFTGWIPRIAGDLWTADDWMALQKFIYEDIRDQIALAKEEITRDGVDRADNADRFDDKTPTDWTDDLDERYAPKLHDHEGQTVYRRYFKRFTADTPEAFLHHELGRFPLVDIYGLWPVSDEVTTSTEVESSDGNPAKFFLYYHHEEADKFGLDVRVYRERIPLGIPIATVLDEYGVGWNKDNRLEDVRNELWKKLLASPNDEISHASSPWIEERIIERSKIGDFMEGSEGGEWPDIRLAFRPRKMEVVGMPFVLAEAPPVERAAAPVEGVIPGLASIPVTHVNYDTLLLEIELFQTGELPENALLDVMLLLRI